MRAKLARSVLSQLVRFGETCLHVCTYIHTQVSTGLKFWKGSKKPIDLASCGMRSSCMHASLVHSSTLHTVVCDYCQASCLSEQTHAPEENVSTILGRPPRATRGRTLSSPPVHPLPRSPTAAVGVRHRAKPLRCRRRRISWFQPVRRTARGGVVLAAGNFSGGSASSSRGGPASRGRGGPSWWRRRSYAALAWWWIASSGISASS
jgi:hypothetical protein